MFWVRLWEQSATTDFSALPTAYVVMKPVPNRHDQHLRSYVKVTTLLLLSNYPPFSPCVGLGHSNRLIQLHVLAPELCCTVFYILRQYPDHQHQARDGGDRQLHQEYVHHTVPTASRMPPSQFSSKFPLEEQLTDKSYRGGSDWLQCLVSLNETHLWQRPQTLPSSW